MKFAPRCLFEPAQVAHEHSNGTASLLTSLFSTKAAADQFVVLRNDELLPHALSGTDVDVSVLPGSTPPSVAAFIIACAHRIGWHPVVISRRNHITALALLPKSEHDDTEAALHFDVFDGITYHGLELVPKAVLRDESEVENGVRRLNDRGKALATLTHHVAWNGGLGKEKYRRQLCAVVEHDGDRRWLHAHVAAVFGRSVAHEVVNREQIEQLGHNIRARRRRVVRALFVTQLRRRPIATIARIARYLFGQLKSFKSPPGLVGSVGSPVPSAPTRTLSLALACKLSPHAFRVPHVRVTDQFVETLNGEGYERVLRKTWRRWFAIRFVAPSVFLYYQAKRGRVILIDRLPTGIRVLQRMSTRPNWVASEPTPASFSSEARGLQSREASE